MVDPRYVELLEHVQGLDGIVPINPRRFSAIPTLRMLRGIGYTAAIDLQGLIKSAALARAVGAWQTIGFPRAHLRESLAHSFYTDTPDTREQQHIVYKNLTLLAPLGVRELRVSFPLDVPGTTISEEVSQRLGPSYAVMSPGAGWVNKRWRPERFGAVAAALRDSMNLPSLVVWGPREEALANAVVDSSRGAAVRAPATSVSDLLGIARAARVMIAGDTGPLHLGAAVGTPIVALFGPSTPSRNGPWSATDVTISRADACACLYRRRCRKRKSCIDDIAVDEVVAAAMRRLGR
jgi:ADP-heptose:LPS heptosyltransferase